MFPVWLILGIFTILMGVFNRQIMERLGSKPNSEVFTNPSRQHASRVIEEIGRWLMATLGVCFLIQGLGETLPVNISEKILFTLLWLAGLMLVAMVGITLANWRAR